MLSREMSVSNMFYSSDKYYLEKKFRDFFSNIKSVLIPRKIKALVCPHAGYVYSGQVASHSYKLLEKELEQIPKTIVLLCPSHYVNFKGVSVGLYDKLKTPFGDLEVDKILGENLLGNYPTYFTLNYKASNGEHSMEVQLPFLKYIIKDKKIKILPLVFGEIDSIKIGEILDNVFKKYPMLFIVSSDLNHYFSYDDAIKCDKKSISAVLSENTDKIIANVEACGVGPWLALNQIASRNKWKRKLLKYQNSGDTAGGKDEVVGYASLAYF
ncbi:MAG: AmmeMemoRadiSam system protein B [Candidatus Gracilibacteria bacterium]|nr:AmmeMemoRadiSam system protein B [Candidatus Gracilibacteria bacterium]